MENIKQRTMLVLNLYDKIDNEKVRGTMHDPPKSRVANFLESWS